MSTNVENQTQTTVSAAPKTSSRMLISELTEITSTTKGKNALGQVITFGKQSGAKKGSFVAYEEKLQTQRYQRDAAGNVVLDAKQQPVMEPCAPYVQRMAIIVADTKADVQNSVKARIAGVEQLELESVALELSAKKEARESMETLWTGLGFTSREEMMRAIL